MTAEIKPPVVATPPVPAFIGTGVRAVMLMVAGWLISSGVTDASLKEAIVTAGSGVLLGVATVGWGMLQKWLAEKSRASQVSAALVLPAGSTVEDLHKALAQDKQKQAYAGS